MSDREFTRLVAQSVTGLCPKLLIVFPLTNAQLDLTKRKNVVEWLANVKHSEAMSEIITAMSTACGASIFLFELFKKKNLESICCPSYGMNAGSSWQGSTWCFRTYIGLRPYMIKFT